MVALRGAVVSSIVVSAQAVLAVRRTRYAAAILTGYCFLVPHGISLTSPFAPVSLPSASLRSSSLAASDRRPGRRSARRCIGEAVKVRESCRDRRVLREVRGVHRVPDELRRELVERRRESVAFENLFFWESGKLTINREAMVGEADSVRSAHGPPFMALLSGLIAVCALEYFAETKTL